LSFAVRDDREGKRVVLMTGRTSPVAGSVRWYDQPPSGNPFGHPHEAHPSSMPTSAKPTSFRDEPAGRPTIGLEVSVRPARAERTVASSICQPNWFHDRHPRGGVLAMPFQPAFAVGASARRATRRKGPGKKKMLLVGIAVPVDREGGKNLAVGVFV
jgi:hypothetical protein